MQISFYIYSLKRKLPFIYRFLSNIFDCGGGSGGDIKSGIIRSGGVAGSGKGGVVEVVILVVDELLEVHDVFEVLRLRLEWYWGVVLWWR